MTTRLMFRENAYLRENGAMVTNVSDDGAIELDRTIFYPQSGGQPGDMGNLRTSEDELIAISNTIHGSDKSSVLHLTENAQSSVRTGDRIICEIDWERRHKLMRMHTALHLLSVVFPFPVTGGAIGVEKGRLDFDMPEIPDDLDQYAEQLNHWIIEEHLVSDEWISDEELAANPQMIKTMKVKPPSGQGEVRLVKIATGDQIIDLQPCGGTHVANTREIGAVRIGKVQKKGKQNRRVYLHFA